MGELQRLLTDWPQMAWVLVGDDGLHDPDLYADLVDRFPGRVAAFALRTAFGTDRVIRAGRPESSGPRLPGGTSAPKVPWVRAPNGEELLPLLQDALGLSRPRGGAPDQWFLTAQQRGNSATRVRPWTEGNAVRALAHGRSYFPVLASALAGAAAGDGVWLAGWRADGDELLDPAGPTVATRSAQPLGGEP